MTRPGPRAPERPGDGDPLRALLGVAGVLLLAVGAAVATATWDAPPLWARAVWTGSIGAGLFCLYVRLRRDLKRRGAARGEGG